MGSIIIIITIKNLAKHHAQPRVSQKEHSWHLGPNSLCGYLSRALKDVSQCSGSPPAKCQERLFLSPEL